MQDRMQTEAENSVGKRTQGDTFNLDLVVYEMLVTYVKTTRGHG